MDSFNPTKTNNKELISNGQVETLSKQINTPLQAVDILQGFNQLFETKNMLLLETCDLNAVQNNLKNNQSQAKSILMLKAAIRIECNDNKVMLKPLSENGHNGLVHISEQLGFNDSISLKPLTLANGFIQIEISYQASVEQLDEESKLTRMSPIDILRVINNSFNSISKNEFSVFLCGLFAYDFIASFEKFDEIASSQNTCPDFVFYLAESLLVIDHQSNNKRLYLNHFKTPYVNQEKLNKTYFELARSFDFFEKQLEKISLLHHDILLTEKKSITDSDLTQVNVDVSDEHYQDKVIQLKKHIVSGDIFQVVPSRTFSLACASPINSYKALKKSNPSPYLFYLLDEEFVLFGASPESSLKYSKKNNMVELYPIAGTRQRGRKPNGEIDLDLDTRIEAELKLDTKEVAEHMMLVDLARNDIARISVAGTTHVSKLLDVDRYSQVMHLVSNVRGNLRPELDALHAYQACMNMGTLTGAPKIKATELLRKTEGKRRGSYGGAIGYLNSFGDMDTCIVIRSAFYKDGVAYIQAGAGIVFDSDPTMETQETSNKAKAVINAILTANKEFMEACHD